MHEVPEDKCHEKHHLCSKKTGRPVILQAGHHARAKNNQPIFGILTQPIPDAWYQEDPLFIQQGYTSYFETSHAEYLHAAGARTVHLDYRTPIKELKKELA